MRILILISLLAVTFSISAQTNNIQTFSKKAYESAVTTVEMRQAAIAEGVLWQNLYKVVLDHLTVALSDAGKTSLINREQAWQEYLISENSFLDQMYFRELQGTMWYPVSDGARARLYEERVNQLLNEYDLLARSQMSYSDFPPELILGAWKSNDLELQFFDDFTAIKGSENKILLFYTILMKRGKLTLTLLNAQDLTVVNEYEVTSQTEQQMVLRAGEKELVFKRSN